MERDQAFLAAFADVEIVVEEIIGEGELVFCRMGWRGRQVGQVLDIPATGRNFEIMGSCFTASGFHYAYTPQI